MFTRDLFILLTIIQNRHKSGKNYIQGQKKWMLRVTEPLVEILRKFLASSTWTISSVHKQNLWLSQWLASTNAWFGPNCQCMLYRSKYRLLRSGSADRVPLSRFECM